MRRTIAAALVFFAAAATSASAQDTAKDAAKDYPNRAIRLVVSVPAGGGVDVVARFFADGLSKKFGQPVVVENRGGVAGNLGGDFVYNAAPDGYTLMASQPAPLTINPLLYKSLTFDPTKFEPVAILTTIANVLMVRKDFPAQDMAQFLAYAKANPGKINYASQGLGTTTHLSAELLQKDAGISMLHVPFKGTTPAINALLGGHVDAMFMELASGIKQHEAGSAHILAVVSKTRVPNLPNIPTFEELGLKGFQSGTWNAIVAPPKTPPAIVAKLNGAINEIIQSDAGRTFFDELGLQRAGGSPADAAAFIKSETAVWSDVIKSAHIEAQ